MAILSSAKAEVTLVPPFTGTQSETFEEFGRRFFGDDEQIPIFGDTAVLSGTRLETATYNQFLMCVAYANPVDGQFFLGGDQFGTIMTVSFSQPVSAVGAYWANMPDFSGCSGGRDTSFVFLDAAGNLIGEDTYPAGPTSTWRWHGWAFTKPVKTLIATGDFLLTDKMQATVTLANSLSNISTRSSVQTGDNILIGGFIVTGSQPKTVLIRGIGPSLGGAGVGQPLADPTLELHSSSALVASNDNWKDTQRTAIENTGIPPGNDLESAIIAQLDPGPYTAILAGRNAGTGVGLVEAYDLNPAPDSKLTNISTRSFVQTGNDVMIGGFILVNTTKVLVRGLGPSLASANVPNSLANPFLELHSQNGSVIASNDDWKETQQGEIDATGIPPTNDRESAVLRALPPGNYTAIVRGVNDTVGVGLIEVYGL
ncbi:MAG: hypothetical protein WAO00_01195 [Chthoniobacterales bacterium]